MSNYLASQPCGIAKNSRLDAKGRSCGSAVSSTKSQILSASLEPCNGNQGKEGFEILIAESSLVDTRSATGEKELKII